jgi:beta-lactamase regulating signal transducer with metallopeptidase domain
LVSSANLPVSDCPFFYTPGYGSLTALKFLVTLLPLAALHVTLMLPKSIQTGVTSAAPSGIVQELRGEEYLSQSSPGQLPTVSRDSTAPHSPTQASPFHIEQRTAQNSVIPNITTAEQATKLPIETLRGDNGDLKSVGSPPLHSVFVVENALTVAMLLWLAGLVWCVVRFFIGYRQVHALIANSRSADEARLLTVYKEVLACFQADTPPHLLMVDYGKPLLCGIWQPEIVLPETLLQSCPDAELRLILAHELAHWQRRDLAWNCLLTMVSTLFFFHPAVWWLRREWHRAQEVACDELALQRVREPVATYGRMLLRVATGDPGLPYGNLAVSVVSGHDTLQGRLKALGTFQRERKRIGFYTRAALLLPVLMLVLSLLPWRFTPRAAGLAVAKETSGSVMQVVDPEKRPVAGATVYYLDLTRGGTPYLPHKQEWVRIVTDRSGRFALPKPKAQDGKAKPHRYALVADAAGYGMLDHTEFSNKPQGGFTAALRKTSNLQLNLQDQQGKPIARRQIRVRYFYDSPRNPRYVGSNPKFIPASILKRYVATTDSNGRCVIKGLPRGVLFGLAVDDERFAPQLASEASILKEDQVKKTVQLARAALVEGRVFFETPNKPAAAISVTAYLIRPRGKARGEYDFLCTKTDKNGNYRFASLVPGSYSIRPRLSKQLNVDWTTEGPSQILQLASDRRLNYKLVRGGLITGRILSEETGKPVNGQYLRLLDVDGQDSQSTSTHADGNYSFRTPSGKKRLILHVSSVSPPSGYALPRKTTFDFTVRNGQTIRQDIKLPLVNQAKITGQVVGPQGKTVADATINIGPHSSKIVTVKSDAQGHFEIDRQARGRLRDMVLLSAQTDVLATPGITRAYPGDRVTLHLKSGVLRTYSGRVLDRAGHPIPGASVKLSSISIVSVHSEQEVKTGATGRFEFKGLHPQARYSLVVSAQGYVPQLPLNNEPIVRWERGLTISLQKADSFVGGLVVDNKGRPVPDASVSYGRLGSLMTVSTDQNGRFYLPGVAKGPVVLDIYRNAEVSRWRKAIIGRTDNRIVFNRDSRKIQTVRRR